MDLCRYTYGNYAMNDTNMYISNYFSWCGTTIYNMMKISKYGNYEKTSCDLSDVERIIRQNNDTHAISLVLKSRRQVYMKV